MQWVHCFDLQLGGDADNKPHRHPPRTPWVHRVDALVCIEHRNVCIQRGGPTLAILDRLYTRCPLSRLLGQGRNAFAHHGAHIFPDRHAATAEKVPAHLYTVRFMATELWGEQGAEDNSEVCVDVFEPYIDRLASHG